MEKIGILILTIVFSAILAAIYGIIHDQITYTISPEYYTKFKFEQFGLEVSWFGGIRQTVAVVGAMATWWVGIFIGLIHGFVGFIHKSPKMMIKTIFKASLITIIVALLVGFIGLAYGRLINAVTIDWNFPENLLDKPNFIAVGSMHNFSYLGGLIGLIVGVVYQVKMGKK